MEEAVCRPALPPWSEQRQRQNYFLRRHAAVEERSAIAALVLAQLRRIDEETIVGREQSIPTSSPTRQAQHVFIREQQRLLGSLGAQVFAELVAKVGARIALGVDGRGCVAVD